MKEEYDFSQGKRGAVTNSQGKTRITIYLDTDTLDAFRVRAEALGTGYQTEINRALHLFLEDQGATPLTLEDIRAVVHEELAAAGR